jgi:hypothetical protein
MLGAIVLLIVGLILYIWGRSGKGKNAPAVKTLGMWIAIIGGAITVLGIILAAVTG